MPRIQDTRFTERFPWERWLSKGKTVLRKGKDFDCEIMLVQQMLRNNMQRDYFRERCNVEKGQVSTSADYDRGTLTITVKGRK